MLMSLDSCSAVARPIVAARAGRPRATAVPATSAALSAWSGERYQFEPSSTAVQRSVTGPDPVSRFSPTTTPTVATAHTAQTVTMYFRARPSCRRGGGPSTGGGTGGPVSARMAIRAPCRPGRYQKGHEL